MQREKLQSLPRLVTWAAPHAGGVDDEGEARYES